MAKEKLRFPEDFIWGTATSSHQIEGNNKNNDWWQAEKEGKVPESGKAADSYNRYEEDFDLAKEAANNAHRFSIEWSRIEPEEGKFDEKEIEHYRKVIRALKERGLEPFITLHHFTSPVWFTDKGGWKNKKAPYYFTRYTEYVIKNLGREADFWITINEPLIYSTLSFAEGVFPPFKNSFFSAYKAARHMAKAHKKAAKIIKTYSKENKTGVTKNYKYFDLYRNQFLARVIKSIMDYMWNKWFFNKIKRYQDFVGINYYRRNKIHVRGLNPRNWLNVQSSDRTENPEKFSDFGWEIYPEGIYHVVRQAWEKYRQPIYIFENGIADADDDQRPDFIRDHLRWLHKAIKEGVDMHGYFHWSLIDCYEWEEGYKMKFGLVEVDFETLERKPRGSYYVYQRICRANALIP